MKFAPGGASHAPHRRRPRLRGSAGLAAAMLAAPCAANALPLHYVETVMTGLSNPRGLVFGSDGSLYVAESGSGGDGPTIVSGAGEVLGYGTTGAISLLSSGVQSRLLSDLPSFAGPTGIQGHGPQELAFGADGRLYVTIGLGADPSQLPAVAGLPGAELIGTVAVIEGGAALVYADIAAFELAEDPDGQGPDTNPYGLASVGDGFIITDAGGNSILSIDDTGGIAVEAVLPNTTNPLPFGPPTYQAVPTGAAAGPDGTFYFGQLTGFPFIQEAAQVFMLSGGGATVVAGGLTNLIGIALGPDSTPTCPWTVAYRYPTPTL